MKKIFTALCVIGFGLMATACQEKSTDEKLKDATAKEAELIKKSVSEKADKVSDAIEKKVDELKK
ncbi:MAG: hypothetical protein COB07_00465 [Sulfurovum sp.]|nr:MAG: hypothetical protein COB07_00465 [Sulfurovum sp.]